MANYSDYFLSFKLKSPLITPLHSDTLFGHICWAIKYLWGDNRLKEFLAEYKEETDVPLLLSSGFPSGHLPRPVLKPLSNSVLISIIQDTANRNGKTLNSSEKTQIQKNLKKQTLVNIETLKRVFADCTAENLLTELCEQQIKSNLEIIQASHDNSIRTHNTVNRLSNTVTDGLYRQSEQFFPSDFYFDVYLRTCFFSTQELENIFQYIENSGFGRDKSTGKGHFEIKITLGNKLPIVNYVNAFMLLSNYVPNRTAPSIGYYQLFTKFGRLGGDYAKSAIPELQQSNPKAKVHPFKKPITMIKPGSIFLGEPQNNYGLLLGDTIPVHKYTKIRHYACAFPVGLHVKEEEFIQ